MAESRRQKKVAAEVQRVISEVLQRKGSNYYGSRPFVTVTDVAITPDLLESKIYLSVYNLDSPDLVINALNKNVHEVRHELSLKMRHQLRRMPELKFCADQTAEDAQRIEDLLKGLNQDEP